MTAAARWRRLVAERSARMAALDAERGDTARFFTGARGRRFADWSLAAQPDPLIARVEALLRDGTTVLDVGAGAGRIALPLAAAGGRVTALDPSNDLLEVLADHASRRGLSTLRTVTGSLPDTAVAPAEIVVCSYVLPLVADAEPFLAALSAAARGRVFVTMSAVSTELTIDTLWRHFHGRRPPASPTYLDALDVLRGLGVTPDLEVVPTPVQRRYDDLEDAVAVYTDTLLLPQTAATADRLRAVLAPWLVPADGGLRAPVAGLGEAILSWEAA